MMRSRYQPVVASLFSLALLGLPVGPVRAAPVPEEVAAAVAAAGGYDYGKSSAPWRAIDRLVNQTRGNAELRATLERALVKLLGSDASLACKQEACRRLWIVGSEAAVPALAKLLSSSDTRLVEAACYALSRCPPEAAGQALRGALAQAQGAGLAAVITVLGDRRDPQADARIAALAGSREAVVADAALAALGKIATPLAVAKLREGRAGGSARQASAAAALLQAGQEIARHGDASAARRVFEELASAPQRHIRRGALLGRIQLGGAEAVPLILAALGDHDEALQAAAVASVSNLRGPGTIGKIAAELSRLPAQQQTRVIEALAGCHEAAALPAIMHAAEHPDVGVRISAAKALGTLGDAGCVPLLLKACGAQDPEEAKVAALALRMLKGSSVNGAILDGLGTALPGVKVELIAVLADRRTTQAVAPLIVQARDAQPSVRLAAWRALGKVAQPKDLPALIHLLAELKEETLRTEAERALARVAQTITDPAHRGDLLLAALGTTREAAFRCSLLRVLGGVGDPPALAAVSEELQATDPAVKDAAVEVLARWPDPQAAGLLLDLLKRSPNQTHRALALEGYVRLVDRMHDQPARDQVRRYAEVMALSHRPEEARLILSGLSRVVDPAALEAIGRCHDPAVANEVALAAIAVARQLPLLDLEAIDATMKTVAASRADEALRREAAGLLVLLFDGKTFAGWEGNLKTFRIEHGAVVGGSLRQGLPHNEFLCTTKPYGNFELRLKCRLVGSRANGGIQFRSRRIPNHHEVRGYQADMAAGAWGTIYDESRRNRVLAGPSVQQQRAIVRADDWNDYVIRCQGPHIQLWLNGHLTADYTEPDASLSQRGIIGLQIHGGPPAEAWYKDIVLRLLPEN